MELRFNINAEKNTFTFITINIEFAFNTWKVAHLAPMYSDRYFPLKLTFIIG